MTSLEMTMMNKWVICSLNLLLVHLGYCGHKMRLFLLSYDSSHTSASAVPVSVSLSPVEDRQPASASRPSSTAYLPYTNIRPLHQLLSPCVEQVIIVRGHHVNWHCMVSTQDNNVFFPDKYWHEFHFKCEINLILKQLLVVLFCTSFVLFFRINNSNNLLLLFMILGTVTILYLILLLCINCLFWNYKMSDIHYVCWLTAASIMVSSCC